MISWGLVPWALQLTRYKWFVLESSSAHYWILETFGSEPATVHRSLGQPGKKEFFFLINRLITLKRSRYLLSFKSLSTSKENICRIRRRSQTTFTKFGFFDHLPPSVYIFNGLQKVLWLLMVKIYSSINQKYDITLYNKSMFLDKLR